MFGKQSNAYVTDQPRDDVSDGKGSDDAADTTMDADYNQEAVTTADTQEKDLHSDGGKYITGIRLHLITALICLSLFLANIEVTITSTSIVNITNDLHGFDESGWIPTAYLLTYTGFLMIWASLSVVLGRKTCVVAALAIFTIFSGACGAAQNMTQLIVFRALQGIGGSGTYVIPFAIAFELAPPAKYPLYGTIIALMFMFALLLGPIWGGAINNGNQWRWIFLLNVPAGLATAVAWLTILPNGFPQHEKHERKSRKAIWSDIQRIDFFGSTLLLGATALLISALQESGTKFLWRSAFTITLLVLSGVLAITFLIWQRFLSSSSSLAHPTLPWRILSREFVGVLGSSFFYGALFMATIFLLPQRYIIVNGLSPLNASVRLIPYTIFSPVGSIVTSILSKKNVPLIYLVLLGSCLQVIAYGLLTTIPVTERISATEYGYEILAGFGTGLGSIALVLIVPFTVEEQDRTIGNGTYNQLRYLGGVVTLAVTTTVLNNYLSRHLQGVIDQEQVGLLLQSSNVLQKFPPSVQETIRQVFGKGYRIQMYIFLAFAAAQIPWSLLMWKRRQIVAV